MVSSGVMQWTFARVLRALAQYCLILFALLVIALATVPWDLQDHPHWRNVAWLPLLTGLVRPTDMLLNLILYVPLGAALQLRRPGKRLWLTVALAVVVAVAIEWAQVWSHSRFPSATDVAMNATGAVLGAAWVRRRAASADAPEVSGGQAG